VVLDFLVDGQTTRAAVEQGDGCFLLTIGERTYRVEAEQREGGVLLLRIDGQPVTALTAGGGTARYVAIDGKTFVLQRAEKVGRRRDSSHSAAGGLSATMPGQVTVVSVRPGDQVERGQTLVVLEAMKMELRITAPAEGKVTAVACAVGDVVARGQVLVEMG